MNKLAKSEFNQLVLKEGVNHFFDGKFSSKPFTSFQSFVFEVSQDERKHVMRFTHSSYRSLNDVKAELDWIHFLHQNHVPVAKPVQSKLDELVAKIDTPKGQFYATCFEVAPGRLATEKEFNIELYRRWGATLGKMHSITNEFEPKEARRPTWSEIDCYNGLDYLTGPEHVIVKQKFDVLLTQIEEIPKRGDNYGLIHGDVHPKNFHINGSELILFDFDGSMYSWFAHDLAVILFDQYEVYSQYREKEGEFKAFQDALLLGYYQNINPLRVALDLNLVNVLMKLEAFGRYIIYQRSKEVPNVPGNMNDYPFYLKYALENDFPIYPFINPMTINR